MDRKYTLRLHACQQALQICNACKNPVYLIDARDRSVRADLRPAERKKHATRENIEQAALALFDRQGYDRTTLAEVAAKAEVAPRTIFAYFESKEDIVFFEERLFYGRLERALTERPSGTTTVDALRAFLMSPDVADTRARLRRRIIAASKTLRASECGRAAPMERILTASIAQDLDADPGDIRPSLAAASMTVAFKVSRNRLLGGSDTPLSHKDTLRVLDFALAFLDGGLRAIQEKR
jgi:AcrR family transcriptional regulator